MWPVVVGVEKPVNVVAALVVCGPRRMWPLALGWPARILQSRCLHHCCAHCSVRSRWGSACRPQPLSAVAVVEEVRAMAVHAHHQQPRPCHRHCFLRDSWLPQLSIAVVVVVAETVGERQATAKRNALR